MSGYIEAGLVIVESGFEICFGASYIGFGFVRICRYHRRFVDNGACPTFSIEGTSGLGAIARGGCNCLLFVYHAFIVAGNDVRQIRRATIAYFDGVLIKKFVVLVGFREVFGK